MFTNGNFNSGNSGARDGDNTYNIGAAGLNSTIPKSARFDGADIKLPVNQADSNTFAGKTAAKPAFIGEG